MYFPLVPLNVSRLRIYFEQSSFRFVESGQTDVKIYGPPKDGQIALWSSTNEQLSTLQYWKNRMARLGPSCGEKRRVAPAHSNPYTHDSIGWTSLQFSNIQIKQAPPNLWKIYAVQKSIFSGCYEGGSEIDKHLAGTHILPTKQRSVWTLADFEWRAAAAGPVDRSGTIFRVLSDLLGAHHPLSPVMTFGVRHPRKKWKADAWLSGYSPPTTDSERK